MSNQKQFYFPRQDGIALIVALIFLVILTILGIATLGDNTLQTRMAYDATQTNIAFQGAESGLSAGENWLFNQSIQPVRGCTGTGGCGQVAASAAYIFPRNPTAPIISRNQFFDETWWQANGRSFGLTYNEGVTPTADGGQAFTTLNDQPRYVIEYLGIDPSGSLVTGPGGPTYQIYDYQVTARSFGETSASRTVVQSVYAKGF